MASLPALTRAYGTVDTKRLIPLLLTYRIFPPQIMLPYLPPKNFERAMVDATPIRLLQSSSHVTFI